MERKWSSKWIKDDSSTQWDDKLGLTLNTFFVIHKMKKTLTQYYTSMNVLSLRRLTTVKNTLLKRKERVPSLVSLCPFYAYQIIPFFFLLMPLIFLHTRHFTRLALSFCVTTTSLTLWFIYWDLVFSFYFLYN